MRGTFLHPALLDAAVHLTLQVLRRAILTALFGFTWTYAIRRRKSFGSVRKRRVDRVHSYRKLTVFFSSYDGFRTTALKREFCIRTISYVRDASSIRKIVNRTHGALSVTWDCSQSLLIVPRKRVLLKSSLLSLRPYT